MTFQEAFENIKKKMANLNTESLPKTLAVQINLTDDDCGGTFYIANIGGNFEVEPYDYYDHTVLLTVDSKNFLKIVNGKLDATDAYFRGIVGIDGNIDHAQALAELVKATAAKKPVEKKTASKKSAPKKSVTKKATKKTTSKK